MNVDLQNWLGGGAAIIASVLLQLGAHLVLLRVVGRMTAQRQAQQVREWEAEQLRRIARVSLAIVFILLIGHLAQVLVWALLFAALGELGDFANAAYFSLASYTTVGAEELTLSRAHRTLGALEAGVGTLMFAWSAAILVTLVGPFEFGSRIRPQERR